MRQLLMRTSRSRDDRDYDREHDRGRGMDMDRRSYPSERREEGGDYHQHVHHHHHEGGSDVRNSQYGNALNEVMEELENKPADWQPYGKGLADLMQIVALEFSQLESAKNSGDRQHIREELEDLAAACIHAHKNL